MMLMIMRMVWVMLEVMVMVDMIEVVKKPLPATYDKYTFLLSKPVDVSHIYVADLHERQQKRLAQNDNPKTSRKVLSVTEGWSLLSFSIQIRNIVFHNSRQ